MRSPLAILIEVAKAISQQWMRVAAAVEAAPASCDNTVVEQKAGGARATEAARKL